MRDNDQAPRLGPPRAPWSRASSPYERRDSLITLNFLYLSNYHFSTALVLFSFVETFPLIYVIELFWNNTKSLRFVLLLRILTIALSSVLILKKCHQFYLHRLQRYLSKLIIISGKAPLNLWGSPIFAALPYFGGAPLFPRCSPKSAEELFYQWLPQMCAAPLNLFLKESHRKWLFSHPKHEQNGPGKKLWLDKCV